MGWINDNDHQRVVGLIARCGLPTAPPVNMNTGAFMRYMAVDKKVAAGKLKLVLLRSLGDAVATAEFPPEALAAQLAQLENA
ncbi:MAG: hypothetical protein EOO68_00100 [Moraxellaceae bacterium]|nr:MAG: hypothetical protein EOO68_00100 [Moraxellaceae bacterium]